MPGEQRGGLYDPPQWLRKFVHWTARKTLPVMKSAAHKLARLKRQQRGGQRGGKKTRAPTLHEQYCGRKLHGSKKGGVRRKKEERQE